MAMENHTQYENNTTNSTSPATEASKTLTEIRLTFYSITFVVGTVGNLLVMVILGRKAKRSIHEMFILNLAVSDLTFIGFCLPINSYELFQTLHKSELYCRLIMLMQTITYFISIFTITSMAIHRCHVIVNPYRRKMANRSAYIWIALIWVVSFIIVTPIAVVSRSVDGQCEEQWLDPYHAKIYTAALFVLQFLLPLCIIAIAYLWIGIYLVKTKGPQTSIGRKRKRENKQIITTLAAIVIIFTMCLLPGQIAWMVRDFGTPTQQARVQVIFKFLNILDFFHACVNPIIYCLLTNNMITRMLCCRKRIQFPLVSPHIRSSYNLPKAYTASRDVGVALPNLTTVDLL